MTDDHDELGRLLHGAVDDIEPRPGLQAIRSRTATKETSMSSSRPWLLAVLGGAVATAAVIGGVVVLTNGDDRAGEDPAPVGPSASAGESPSSDPAEDPSPTDTESSPGADESPRAADPGATRALPIYYVGEVPDGLGLYREFQADDTGDDQVLRATERAVEGDAVDPDYRSAWPEGADVTSVDATTDLITVDLAGDLRNRPSGMTEREAQLAVEQVIYTAQAAFGEGRVPVQFLIDGGRTDQVLGVPASEGLANGPVLQTLAHVNLTTPFQGQVVSGDTLEVTGVANSFEANVVLRLRPQEGTDAVAETFATAEGWMGEKLFPFSTSIDVSDVAPGKYVLVAMTDDPSGGTEGPGAYSDTKVIEIE